jgi:hypothetical protein
MGLATESRVCPTASIEDADRMIQATEPNTQQDMTRLVSLAVPTGSTMDMRYRARGYSAKLTEAEDGAYLTIARNNIVIGEVAVTIFSGGPDTPASILVKRFRRNELRDVTAVDDYDDA